MPIILIWNAAAFPFVPFFRRMLNDIFYLARGLEEGLKRRFDDAEKALDLTAAYPVFRFTDEAVSAYVTRAQAGLALGGPPRTLTQDLAGLLPHFDYKTQWANKITEARLIPRLFAVLAQITGAVSKSVARFQSPKPGMFAEGGVSAIDLTGMAALAFRTFGAGRAGIYERFRAVAEAMKPAPAPGESEKPPAGAPPAELPLWMQVETWGREIAGALILLPALARLMPMLWQDLSARLRNTLLTEFADIEKSLYDSRAAFLTGLSHGMMAFATATIAYATAASDFALAHLKYWGDFATDYVQGLGTGLSSFAAELGTFWGGVMSMIEMILTFGAQLMAIDLTELVHNALVSLQYLCDFMIHLAYDEDENPVRYQAPARFRVTAGQLALGEGGGTAAKAQLALGVARLNAILAGAPKLKGMLGQLSGHYGVNLQGILSGIGLLTQRIGRPALPPGAQPVLRYATENEPDLVKLLIDPAHKGALAIVNDLGNKANEGLQGAASDLTKMLEDAAGEFDKAAAHSTRSGLGRSFAKISAGADKITAQAFPAQAEGEPSPLQPLSDAFARGFAGGFRTMEAALGGFLGFVIAEWQAHRAEGSDALTDLNATSPHILLKHAELARVHMPEMVMRLRPGQLDAATAKRIAQRFAGAVSEAYAQGLSQIAAWTVEAAAREAPVPVPVTGGKR